MLLDIQSSNITPRLRELRCCFPLGTIWSRKRKGVQEKQRELREQYITCIFFCSVKAKPVQPHFHLFSFLRKHTTSMTCALHWERSCKPWRERSKSFRYSASVFWASCRPEPVTTYNVFKQTNKQKLKHPVYSIYSHIYQYFFKH